MNSQKSDPKVKKTLVRNCEQKPKPALKKRVCRDVECSTKIFKDNTQKASELSEPSLCSSEALAHYLSDVKTTSEHPPAAVTDDLNVDTHEMYAKMTKKLNFQFNDRIYRNLIELNINAEEIKKKNKRPLSAASKKDLEPNIADFTERIVDEDSPPHIPAIKPKFKTVKNVENGYLHKLMATFENL